MKISKNLANCIVVTIFVVSTLLANASGSTNKQVESNSVWQRGSYSLGLRARSLSFVEGQEEAQLVQVGLTPNMNLPLSSFFTIRGRAGINFNSGRVQTRFQDPTTDSFVLQELVGVLSSSEAVVLEVGAIDQAHLQSDLLVANRAFPGVLLKAGYAGKGILIRAKAQQAIPESTSFDSDRTELEAVPAFQTQGLEFYAKPFSWFETEAQVNHFSFSDLPSKVAFESGRFGNSVDGTEASESRFLYPFDGWMYSVRTRLNISSYFKPFLDVQIIENGLAPKGEERSQLVGLGLPIHFKNVSVVPRFSQIYAEANSSPAYYGSSLYGHNNREGIISSMRIEFLKLGFAMEAQYVDLKVIYDHPIQEDMKFLALSVELLNESF